MSSILVSQSVSHSQLAGRLKDIPHGPSKVLTAVRLRIYLRGLEYGLSLSSECHGNAKGALQRWAYDFYRPSRCPGLGGFCARGPSSGGDIPFVRKKQLAPIAIGLIKFVCCCHQHHQNEICHF